MRISLFILLILPLLTYGQSFEFNKHWQFLGPDSIPWHQKYRPDVGVGPVEFIRVHPTEEGLMMAGALHGGLFVSKDGANSWVNAGSDDWPYSGSCWADFHPAHSAVWFAVCNKSGNNGKPGKIGRDGGLMRTQNAGIKWERIATHKTFGTEHAKIYGTRFHPAKENTLFMMTSNGLYYTDNCMALVVKWTLIEGTKGIIYDMDFQGHRIFLSNFYKGNWSLISIDWNSYADKKVHENAFQTTDALRNITTEPIRDKLLVLVDQKSKPDALWEYDPEADTSDIFMPNQRVNFGSGHTFAVNPHNQNEIFLGNSTRCKRYNYTTRDQMKVNTAYHVDIEFIAYDPIDSNKRYMATHGGVYVSEDNALSWKNKSYGLGIAEVMGMAVSRTDPNQVVIGCFHDGSSVLADWDKTGVYYWRIVNGGDALIPFVDPTDAAVVYTSNQYVGGGIYYSDDTAKSTKNIHSANRQKTSGWEMAAALHPINNKMLFYNFMHKGGESKGNIDACRTDDASKKKNAEEISNFAKTHNLKTYKVYGLFNSSYYPDRLYAYVLHYDKDSENKKVTRHRVFVTTVASAPADTVMNSWKELEMPISNWIGDIEPDPAKENVIYVSYTAGKSKPETMFGDKSIIYALKYKETKDGNYIMKREIDITRNVPNTQAGRYNIQFPTDQKRQLFFATRTGVWMADRKVLKGRSRWRKVGHGLPHCKIYGFDYHPEKHILTVGLFGRGVWRYYLTD